MPLTSKDDQLIDDFLQNRLSNAGEKLLKTRLQDAEFQAEMEFRKNLMVSAKKLGRAQAKAELQGLEAARKGEKTTVSRVAKVVPMRRWWLVAAVIVGLLLAGIWWVLSVEDSQELYAQYYEVYPNVVTQAIVKGENDTTALVVAFQAYELRNFGKAQKLFATLPKTLTNDFYRGVIELELGNLEKATLYFTANIEDADSPFFIPAHYYLGLIDLENDKVSTATIRYFKIVEKAAAYPYLQKKAAEILDVLENE